MYHLFLIACEDACEGCRNDHRANPAHTTIHRHFTRKDLKEMFALGDTTVSQTADQLYDLNCDKMQYAKAIEDHIVELRYGRPLLLLDCHLCVFFI